MAATPHEESGSLDTSRFNYTECAFPEMPVSGAVTGRVSKWVSEHLQHFSRVSAGTLQGLKNGGFFGSRA